MNINDMKNSIMAILFASGDAVEVDKISFAIGSYNAMVLKHINELNSGFEETNSPFMVLNLEKKVQLVLRESYNDLVKSVMLTKRNVPLSPASMEVLAIIAYNQPVTKGFIEQIRGVDSVGIVNSLVEKGLVTETGRLEIPGKPVAFGTTHHFLRTFGMSSLDELVHLEYKNNNE